MSDCVHCGEREAVCVGKYEGAAAWEYACDVCCGHGCEDGRCHLLEDLNVAAVLEDNDTLHTDLAAARARIAELEGQVAALRDHVEGYICCCKERDPKDGWCDVCLASREALKSTAGKGWVSPEAFERAVQAARGWNKGRGWDADDIERAMRAAVRGGE